jgi:hypothetical protein
LRVTPLLLTAGLLVTGCSSADTRGNPQSAPTVLATLAPTTDGPSSTPTPEPVVTTPAPVRTSPKPVQTPSDPLSPRPPLETAPAPGNPRCQPETLSVVDADQLSSATATQEVFALRTSGPDCQLTGFPSLEFRDSTGAPLVVTVTHGGYGASSGPAKVTTLSKATSASFVVGTPRSGRCVAAARVIVGVPGGGTVTASTTLSVCAGKAGVSPIGRRVDEETG